MPEAYSRQSVRDNPLTWVARIGDVMQRNQRGIEFMQWLVVLLYAFLLFAPLAAPAFTNDFAIWEDLRLIAQFVFWGIGWPLIMLSMMIVGRIWCGIFCPDGTLTEFASRHGRKNSIPRWIRWHGWPLVMLVSTTLYGQLVGVYASHAGTLLLLGLPTLGALWTGYQYANGKRVWCMYLCPANAVFALLAKIAPLHYRVDETRWKQYPLPLPKVDCPPLIDIRRMKSASACHACGRCSGYLDAVEFASRSPGSEILDPARNPAENNSAIALIMGVLGICTAAMHWVNGTAYKHFHNWLARHLFDELAQHSLPWWLLAQDPRPLTLLDGMSILLYITFTGSVLGVVIWLTVKTATNISACPNLSWQRLALALIPIAGASTVVGLTASTSMLLYWRVGLLAFGCLFSAWLGWRLLMQRPTPRSLGAFAVFMLPVMLIYAIWIAQLFG